MIFVSNHPDMRPQIDDRSSKVLEWLSPLDPQRKHDEIRSRRMQNSGLWLLESTEYETWCNDNNSPRILWCRGIPGAGKTIISSLIIDELSDMIDSNQTKLAYFYYDYSDAGSQTIMNVIGSLLRQLISQLRSVPTQLMDVYDRRQGGQEQPQLDDIIPMLIEICKGPSTTHIVIDALDECQSGKPRQTILDVLKHLEQLKVRILITSRPHAAGIEKELGNFPQILIEASASDITKCIVEAIERDDNAADTIDVKLRNEIITQLCGGAQGM